MIHSKIVTIIAVFLLGWLASSCYQAFPLEGQVPFGHSREQLSPGDWITEDNLYVQPDRLTIQAEGVTISRFANTNSMDPVLDESANGIEMAPEQDKLQPGDVIAYKPAGSDYTYVHRIVQIGQDEQGTFYIVKGDNNQFEDPGKVRFEQIQGVVIGVLY